MLHKFEIANTPKKFPENISANMFQTVIRQSTFLSSQHSHRIFHSFPAPRIAKVFKYIDYNGSGTITLDEIDEKAYQAYLRGRAFWISRLFYITKRSEHTILSILNAQRDRSRRFVKYALRSTTQCFPGHGRDRTL